VSELSAALVGEAFDFNRVERHLLQVLRDLVQLALYIAEFALGVVTDAINLIAQLCASGGDLLLRLLGCLPRRNCLLVGILGLLVGLRDAGFELANSRLLFGGLLFEARAVENGEGPNGGDEVHLRNRRRLGDRRT
jgi:hypothetical protein